MDRSPTTSPGNDLDQLLGTISADLAEDGVYVDPAVADQLDADAEAALATQLAELPEPAYVVLYPFARNDRFGGSGDDLVTRLQSRQETPGVFITSTISYPEPGEAPRLDVFDWTAEAGGRDFYELSSVLDRLDLATTEKSLTEAVDLLGQGESAIRELDAQLRGQEYGDGGSGLDGEGSGAGVVVAVVVLAVALLAALVALARRRSAGTPTPARAPAVLPTSAVERIRDAHDRGLDRRARAELLELGERLDEREIAPRDDRDAWQAALDHYDAARGLLDAPDRERNPHDVLDVVGALVLLERGRTALDRAQRGRPFRPQAHCYLNPLHGHASQARRVEVDGRALEVPLCSVCREALRRDRTPDILDVEHDGEPRHWFEVGAEPWTSTGYGALDPDLLTALQRRH